MQMDVQVTTLPSGVRVVTSRMPHLESASCGIWVGVGGRHESARMSGASHFIEHLLFKGTATRTARAISQAIEGRGGYFNAFTQEESTCYYARIRSRHLWSVLDILADMYVAPRFAEDDINRERGVIVEEIMMYRDQPQHVVQERLSEMLWDRHALGRSLTGTPENVRRFTRDDLLGFKDRWYGPRATVVSFAGQVDHEQCVQEVADRLSWNGRQRKGRYPVVDRSTGQLSVDVIQKDIEQTHLAMGFRVFGRHDPRRYALKILSVILGENMSSRLFQVVREKHGMAYAVHSSIHLYEDTGALVISAGLDRARGAKALELIIRELVRLKERSVGAQELRRAKDYAIGHLMIGLESSSSQMLWLGENLISYNRIRQPDFIIDRLERTTREDIQKLAGQILKAARVSLSMVTPDAERYPADACKQTVRALSGVK